MRKFVVVLIILFCGTIKTSVLGHKIITVADGYSGTSINTAIFRNSALVSYKDYQYISFYDNDGYVVVGKRKLGEDTWITKRTQFRGTLRMPIM